MNQQLYRKMVLAIAICVLELPLYAQLTAGEISSNLSNDDRVTEFTMDPSRGTPSLIKLNETGETLALDETPAFLQSVLGFGQETNFQMESTINTQGVQVNKLQQYTNSIKVEHGVFKVISQKGIVRALMAEYYNLPASISSSPTLTEESALQQALDHVGATTYAWEYIESLGDSPELTEAYNEVYPQGELVLVDNYLTDSVDVSLAYKFNIYAAEPLSRAYVYVDATSGEILLLDAIIKHAESHSKQNIIVPAQGDTRYAGTRNFDTSQDTDGNWALNGVTPTGVENETLSYEGMGGLPLSIPALSMLAEPIVDGDGDLLHPETADNNWTAAEHRKDRFSTTNPYPLANESNNDDVALDAHWGAEVVLIYWQDVHNRNSYDDQGTKVTNFVHYGDAYDNAFWNGSSMTYGDGSYQGGTNPGGAFAPLTSMDVCSHEIAHGVCEYTSNLVYQRESGAMNEGFSDIWAAAVEDYVLVEIDDSLNYDPWGIGEQIDERDGGIQPGQAGSRALRWMDDPKAVGDPDCYGGENWINPECGTPTLINDQCGVHTNSGVLNKWYYLLVTGSGQSFSPGLNKQPADDQLTDAGNSYTVAGLGFTTASHITYLAETMLSPNAKYAEMREASILAAQILYGIGSNEEQQTTNAWHAVDIGEAYDAGEPNTIVFSESNLQIYTESNSLTGCEDFNSYSVVITGVEVSPSSEISISTAGSTATEGQDFALSTPSLSFSGSENKSFEIIVYDDAIVETSETIVLSFVYNGNFQKQEFAISDNDFSPRTGVDPIELLSENFNADGMPAEWTIVELADGVNNWAINGQLSAAGRAYVTDGTAEIPFYDQLSASNYILRSPLINGAATSDVIVTFDWEVAGETDVDPEVLYDYGEFVYSTDGANYSSVEKYVGSGPLGVEITSGTYSDVINDLDGKPFYLGWRWYNDALVGSEYSFSIDNVHVAATPAGIETQAGESATSTVPEASPVYFQSNSDDALIARIENATADLGCVTVSVIEGGTSFEVFSNISTARPSKVFSITTENSEASYDLTVYFTDDELTAFETPAELIPIKVNAPEIDDAHDRPSNFQLNGVLTDENTEAQYRAYTGTFTGSGNVSVVKDFSYCTYAPEPWVSADIGNVAEAGSVCHIDGNFEISASGTGIQNDSDGFHFLYQSLTGNGELIAQVHSLEQTDDLAKAGIMIRETLDPTSKFAMTTFVANAEDQGNGVRLEYRKHTGGKTKDLGYRSQRIPQYIRLVREGDRFTAYISQANESWDSIASVNLAMGDDVYFGLAVTSNNNALSTVAALSDVSVISGSGGARLADEQENRALTPGIAVFPNPVKSTLNVDLQSAKVTAVDIYRVSGQLVRTINLSIPDYHAEMDLSELSKGLFLLRIRTEDGNVIHRRFLKE